MAEPDEILSAIEGFFHKPPRSKAKGRRK